MSRSPITCHILDTTLGKPAREVNCAIYHLPFNNSTDEELKFALLKTDNDGRISNWTIDPSVRSTSFGIGDKGDWNLQEGVYKIRFQTSGYFKKIDDNNRTFFPFIDIIFQVDDAKQHYHVPLLLANHSYTTYRGS